MIQCVMDSLGMGTGEAAPPQPKKTWLQLKEQVCDVRRQVSSQTVILPSCLNFRTLPCGKERIYFLSAPSNGWEMTLVYVDVPLLEIFTGSLKWHPLIESSMVSGGTGRMSREEALQWERKRLSSWGITSYEIHANTGRIVFPAVSTLYQCVDSALPTGGLVLPTELRSGPTGAKLSPQICPCNSNLVAYVNENDIYVTVMPSSGGTSSGVTQRVTFCCGGPVDAIMAGNPSYVMQEEFNRYVGFWWQPTTSADTYRILFEEVDESGVTQLTFQGSEWGESDELRFPRAGSPNAISQLRMVEFRLVDGSCIEDVRVLSLRCTLQELFPWAEYMVRVGWTPKGHHVWLSMLNRRQNRLDLCLLDPSEFVDLIDCDATIAGANWRPTVHTIHTQCSDVWINVDDVLVFFPYERDAKSISFVTASEDTGFRHLYLVHYDLDQPELRGSLALTSGDWPVIGKSVWLDDTRQLVYFMGLRETPLEKHLYVVSLRKPNHVRLLTVRGSSYHVFFNQACSLCVVSYSNTETVPACEVLRVVNRDWSVDGVTLVPAGFIFEPRPALSQYRPNLYSHVISSGHKLYAMLLKPHDYEPGRKYPTILHVYGGPEVQLVTNTYKGMRLLRMHMLAARGYCVLSIDSRGSQNRGLHFEAHIKGRMGSVELADQVEVLFHLAETLGCIDLSRVGIHGWSYGGYLSLMALVQYPQVFKISIAGAPVTCWNLYDTGYTERYMDLPDLNPLGYTEGSVLTHVSQFPDEENRLLIIHGLIDENVHFYHTTELVNTLVKEGKPYQLQVYPTERHSLRNMEASKHYETMLLSFLQNYL